MTSTTDHDLLPVLDETERAELAAQEEVITRGRRAFLEVGSALAVIRDGRLYRQTHATFEDYCQERWEFGRHRINRLIAASQACADLEPIGTNGQPLPLPQNEWQARALVATPPDDRDAVWREAVETAPDGKMTAAHVERVIDARLERAIQAVMDDDEDACRRALGMPPERTTPPAAVSPPISDAPRRVVDPHHPWMKVMEIIEHLKGLAAPPLMAAEFRRLTDGTLMSPAREQARVLAPAVRAFLDAITQEPDSR